MISNVFPLGFCKILGFFFPSEIRSETVKSNREVDLGVVLTLFSVVIIEGT